MSHHYPEIEQILAYVEGKMNPEERSVFELHMSEDEALAIEVGEMKMYAQRKKQPHELTSHATIVRDTLKNKGNKNKAIKNFPAIYAIAAGILLLIVASFWLSGTSGNSQELAHDYLAWNAQPEVRGTSQNSLLSEAIAKGMEKKWSEAIPLLESTLAVNPSFVEAKLYLGRAYLLSGNQEKGIQVLSAILSDSTSLPNTQLDAHWYRGLGYLYANECQFAKRDLTSVVSKAGNIRKKKALSLLETCK